MSKAQANKDTEKMDTAKKPAKAGRQSKKAQAGTPSQAVAGEQTGASERPQRNRNGTFAQGHAGGPGRPVGSVNGLLRQAREAAENIALPKIIEEAQAGDMFACRTLLQLGLPKQRPVAIAEPFTLPGETMSEKAQAVIELVANGTLSTQTASELASIISTACKVDELTELRMRIEAIDQKLQEMSKHG